MNTTQALNNLKINSVYASHAVQDVRELIEGSPDPIGAARTIINSLTLIGDHTINDPTEARMTAQYLVERAIKLGADYDPQQALKHAAKRIGEMRVSDPYFFRTIEVSPVASTITITTAAPKQEGAAPAKVGSKKEMAQALYEKNKTLSNQELVALFMKDLTMSKAGATTYVYNCKKAAK